MFKNMLKILSRYKLFINPLLLVNALISNNSSTTNTFKRESEIVVSLYANENNFNIIHLSLYSIFNQTVIPDKIILWLSNEYELSELPYTITKYIKFGLEIKFVKDKDSYTNTVYALKEYNDSIVVIADAGIIYPKNWLKLLYHSYISNPLDIQVHSALKVSIEKSAILPFKDWEMYVDMEGASYKYVPESTGGVLFPPKCFVNDIFREDIYKKSNLSWNIWCWIIALVSNRKIRVVKNHIKKFYCFNLLNRIKNEYLNLTQNNSFDNILEYYKQNVYIKLRSEKS